MKEQYVMKTRRAGNQLHMSLADLFAGGFFVHQVNDDLVVKVDEKTACNCLTILGRQPSSILAHGLTQLVITAIYGDYEIKEFETKEFETKAITKI